MLSPKRAGRNPATRDGFSKLASAGAAVRQADHRRLKRWAIRLAVVVVTLVVLWELLLVGVRIWTTDLWFDSVHAGPVYTTMLRAQVLLFCVFAVVGGIIGGLAMVAVTRLSSPLPFSQDNDTFRWAFRRIEHRLRKLFVVLAVVIPAVLTGRAAANGWQTYLLWRHATPWHQTDSHFHKDLSFFMEVNPFHLMVVSLISQPLTYAFWIVVVGGYWYGGWRLRRGRRKITRSMTKLLSFLLAGYLLLRAIGYWQARYNVVTSNRGPVTGPSYTDLHAALPSDYVMLVISALAVIGVLVNAFRAARVRVLVGTLVLVLVAASVIGSTWPGLVYHYQEAPSAAKVDLSDIRNNRTATLSAFGLDNDITTVHYDPSKAVTGTALQALARKTAQTPVIDPNRLSPTFNVEQQLQAYYGFKSTLDLDHYDINGRSQDVAVAARELTIGGIPHSTWVNSHLVYTHGYGVVAAPTTKVDPKTESPSFLNGGMPPGKQIPITRPQIYFGQAFSGSSYSIVGEPAGSRNEIEFDHPAGAGIKAAHNTYQGHGGIPVGSTLRRLLFAIQLHDPNIFFSSELNSASQLLTVRNPSARVAKVAPWLTLDGDVYPAIVNGRIKWIVDGYTSSSNYPNSQQVNLRSATTTTLNANGASSMQSNTQVNYFRNSVKAVVDAYTGRVTLYSWDQQQHPDPLLDAWESAFPNLVQPQSDIPSALLAQLRYPTDLFNLQRYILAKYHVSDAASLYNGNDFWTVPTDPTYSGSASMPSRYMSMASDGFGDQHYSLSSPMVTLNGRQLAAFVYVNSEPGPDYGKFTVLHFSSGAGGESPTQVQNDIESNTKITESLTLQRGGNSNVILGDMEAIPVAGRMLYVEPVYTQSKSSSSFPILRHVIALYGNGDPSFADKLKPALNEALRSGQSTG